MMCGHGVRYLHFAWLDVRVSGVAVVEDVGFRVHPRGLQARQEPIWRNRRNFIDTSIISPPIAASKVAAWDGGYPISPLIFAQVNTSCNVFIALNSSRVGSRAPVTDEDAALEDNAISANRSADRQSVHPF